MHATHPSACPVLQTCIVPLAHECAGADGRPSMQLLVVRFSLETASTPPVFLAPKLPAGHPLAGVKLVHEVQVTVQGATLQQQVRADSHSHPWMQGFGGVVLKRPWGIGRGHGARGDTAAAGEGRI